MADQQFCLRWNNHQSTLISVFDSLLENGTLVDCTLAAEGKYLKAHKVVLSACSPYLETLLSQHYEKHPIVILKDVKFTELKSMMDYMYRGEVNISQDQLGTFLKAAESLQIKGLSDNGSDGDGRDVGSTSKGPPPRKTQPAASTRPVESQRPDLAPASPAHRSRDGSISPSSRKRRRTRRNSQDDDANMGDSHLDSNSCDLPSQAQSTPIVPNIPAAVTSSITTTPIKTIVKPEQTELVVNRIDTSNLNSLPPESGLLKEKIEPISEPLLEPKTEYLDDANNDDSVEDLTLDDDDEMDEMDMSNMSNMSNISRPGPSHGNDVSNQGFVPWQMANQSGTDEVFMAAQEAVQAHRGDSQGDSINRNPDVDQEEYNFASAFCSVGYGPTENYFSELNLHVDNDSHSVGEKRLCLGKEIEDFNIAFYDDNTVYHNELSIRDDTKDYQFPGKCGMRSKDRKRPLKYKRITKNVGNCNGHNRGSKKEKRIVKQKMSQGRKPTGKVEVTSSGRERRPLIWSGDSFTTISQSNGTTCEPHNELKPKTKRKGCVKSKMSDAASVPRKKGNTDRSMYYKSGVHIPGSFKCEACGRSYCYKRGLRQHMRDSCEPGKYKGNEVYPNGSSF